MHLLTLSGICAAVAACGEDWSSLRARVNCLRLLSPADKYVYRRAFCYVCCLVFVAMDTDEPPVASAVFCL